MAVVKAVHDEHRSCVQVKDGDGCWKAVLLMRLWRASVLSLSQAADAKYPLAVTHHAPVFATKPVPWVEGCHCTTSMKCA